MAAEGAPGIGPTRSVTWPAFVVKGRRAARNDTGSPPTMPAGTPRHVLSNCADRPWGAVGRAAPDVPAPPAPRGDLEPRVPCRVGGRGQVARGRVAWARPIFLIRF